jgi:hypothetical protein
MNWITRTDFFGWTTRWMIAITLALGCALGTHAQAQSGSYSPSDAGKIHRAPPAKPSNGASYNAGNYPTFRLAFAPGEGSREVDTYCNVCHTPRYILMQPAVAPGTWADEVNKMIKTYGANVPDDAAQKIISYLQANYTVETRKR